MTILITSANYLKLSISAQISHIVPDKLLIGGRCPHIQRSKGGAVHTFTSVMPKTRFYNCEFCL